MADPSISVIIVTHNSEQYLPSCAHHLATALGNTDNEVIVVDNASDRAPSEEDLVPLEHVVILRNETNRGFATGANQGVTRGTKDTILFLNPDVLLDDKAVYTLYGATVDHPKAGAVGARLRYPDGSFQATCRRLPTPGNILFSRGSMLGRLLGQTRVYTLPDVAVTTEVPAVAGTVLMLRRLAFEQVRGFDERFFMYMEDTDLCARLQQAGYVNLFVPDAGGVHHWGRGSTAGALRRNWYHHRSVLQYFLKHYPNGFTVVLLPFLLAVNFVVRALVELVKANE
ncbi:glycosyltransferase [candidate division GN15 bacterium]|nr:glycosyltransferase [candidate division GN15 bacterium]